LLYASSAWWGFTNTTDRQRVNAFLNRGTRSGFCPPDLRSFEDKGGATDLKVGGTKYLRAKRAKNFSVDPPTFGIVGVHKLNKVLLRRVAHFANFYYVIISLG